MLRPAIPSSTPALPAVLELLKPITWFPPMWAFGCGVASAGGFHVSHPGLLVTGIVLTGPLVCATSQAVNDWYDRHVDAINEPGRPIPSGRIPGNWGFYIALCWTALSLAVATQLGRWGFYASCVGLVLAWLYSAPPVRLKQNGWWGNSAVGLCYEGLPWITGAALTAAGSTPDLRSVALALLYSFGAHGIMTLNDFKSIEGDRQMGVRSLPVQLGVRGAGLCACAVMTAPQVVVAALLASWACIWQAAGIATVLAIQLLLMRRWLKRPRELAPWYQGTGVTLYVLGMLLAASALPGLAPSQWGS
jgi:chlorophyll synthase